VNDEIYLTADFNTVATPISVSSLSPASAVAGGTGFTLTINGAGFTATRLRSSITHSDRLLCELGQVDVPVSASDIATPGAIQVFVENFPNGASCAAFSAKPFFVLNGVGTSAGISRAA